MKRKSLRSLLALALAGMAGACGSRAGSEGSAPPASVDPRLVARRAALAEVRAFEASRRKSEFSRSERSDVALGADPYDIASLPGGGFVGILRGRSAIVRLDSSLRETARAPAPRSTTGLALGHAGEIFVSGEADANVHRYRLRGDALELASVLPTDALGVRDLCVGSAGTVHAIDSVGQRLLTLRNGKAHEVRSCRGATSLACAGSWIVASCLFDHTLVIWRSDARGIPTAEPAATIRHDGPFWGVDVAPSGAGLLIAAGGVEDHPLDRTIGSFGFIDSFLWLYRVAGSETTRLASVNLSEHGVVTPKAIALEAQPQLEVEVHGFGSDRRATISLENPQKPVVTTLPALPGTTALARTPDGGFAAANTLLDAWVSADHETLSVSKVPDDVDGGALDARVGELLVFTTLIAPRNTSAGPLSRFTCEACHFEGGVDGRVHHTGRQDVRVTTKPLLGLANNRPHFSRALDRDLTQVAHNEFRVAGAGSGSDPWFSVRLEDAPWLAHLGVDQSELSAAWLRRALVAFLGSYHPPSNLYAGRERSELTPLERRGAELFRARCEGCHQARLASDDAGSRLPFSEWQSAILGSRGIVWAKSDYEKTGIEPYVHARGARVPSLRRMYAKWPYFTDGSAQDLPGLLERARWGADHFWHRAPDAALHQALSAEESQALVAFLHLL